MAKYITNLSTGSKIPERGDIYYADFDTTIVAVLTTNCTRLSKTHVPIHRPDILEMPGHIYTEQLKTIKKCRLENFKGNVGPALMKKVDEAILYSMGLCDVENED